MDKLLESLDKKIFTPEIVYKLKDIFESTLNARIAESSELNTIYLEELEKFYKNRLDENKDEYSKKIDELKQIYTDKLKFNEQVSNKKIKIMENIFKVRSDSKKIDELKQIYMKKLKFNEQVNNKKIKIMGNLKQFYTDKLKFNEQVNNKKIKIMGNMQRNKDKNYKKQIASVTNKLNMTYNELNGVYDELDKTNNELNLYKLKFRKANKTNNRKVYNEIRNSISELRRDKFDRLAENVRAKSTSKYRELLIEIANKVSIEPHSFNNKLSNNKTDSVYNNMI